MEFSFSDDIKTSFIYLYLDSNVSTSLTFTGVQRDPYKNLNQIRRERFYGKNGFISFPYVR